MPVDLEGVVSSSDWHHSPSAARQMPVGRKGDRAVLAQSEGNVAALRGLNLDLRQPLDPKIGPGAFGENLWLEGELKAASLCIGDTFVASRDGAPTGLVLQVSSPRGPCSSIDSTHGRTPGAGGVSAACARLGLAGWFFRVLSPGDLAERDVLRLTARPHPEWTLERVSAVVKGAGFEDGDREADLGALVELEELAPFEWRDDAWAAIGGPVWQPDWQATAGAVAVSAAWLALLGALAALWFKGS